MDRQKLKQLVDTFFVCNRAQIREIFDEFLSAMEAESTLPPGGVMSRNYETAQANPEIHTLPGNLKDARDAVFPFFWGTDGWYSKLHLENVKGPANFASLIGGLACLLKNPNLCVDTYCLRSNELEVKAITALANLIFYHTESPWGVFTMGGTISNLYGGKLGIEKVVPNAMQERLGRRTRGRSRLRGGPLFQCHAGRLAGDRNAQPARHPHRPPMCHAIGSVGTAIGEAVSRAGSRCLRDCHVRQHRCVWDR